MEQKIPKFAIIRLGKDSVSDIKKLDSLHDTPSVPVSLTVSCTQVPLDVGSGFFALIYLGSDNSKGVPTEWEQGLRALGQIISKEGGPRYGDRWTIKVNVKAVFPCSVSKNNFLAKAPNAYYWFSGMPVIGLSSYSNQTVQQIKLADPTQEISALFYALETIHKGTKAQVEKCYSELNGLFDFTPPSNNVEPGFTAAVVEETTQEKIEGLDKSETTGWDDYPLDSVFVRKDQRTVIEVVKRIKDDRFILHPDFQRDFVWSHKKQSRLIESCLMRIPLPVFYVAEAKDGRIIVVDGLQRLNTFTRFLENEFSLSSLGAGRENSQQDNNLIGKRFKDLPITLQERVEDTQLTLYILDSKAPSRAKLDIFERVNSGEPLSRQQMRNSLYNGPATSLLAIAAKTKSFINVTDGGLNKKTMRDREAINRFCAFRLLGVDKYVKEYKGEMDDFLAATLENVNGLSKEEMNSLLQAFEKSMRLNYLLFNKHAFRKSLAGNALDTGRTVINISLFDVCSVLFADLEETFVEEHAPQFRDEISNLLNNDEFGHSITYGTNGISQVSTRFEMLKKTIAEVV